MRLTDLTDYLSTYKLTYTKLTYTELTYTKVASTSKLHLGGLVCDATHRLEGIPCVRARTRVCGCVRVPECICHV